MTNSERNDVKRADSQKRRNKRKKSSKSREDNKRQLNDAWMNGANLDHAGLLNQMHANKTDAFQQADRAGMFGGTRQSPNNRGGYNNPGLDYLRTEPERQARISEVQGIDPSSFTPIPDVQPPAAPAPAPAADPSSYVLGQDDGTATPSAGSKDWVPQAPVIDQPVADTVVPLPSGNDQLDFFYKQIADAELDGVDIEPIAQQAMNDGIISMTEYMGLTGGAPNPLGNATPNNQVNIDIPQTNNAEQEWLSTPEESRPYTSPNVASHFPNVDPDILEEASHAVWRDGSIGPDIGMGVQGIGPRLEGGARLFGAGLGIIKDDLATLFTGPDYQKQDRIMNARNAMRIEAMKQELARRGIR